MANPLSALAKQFVLRSPTTLLAIGVVFALLDFALLYISAAKDGVLYINQGIGLLNHHGLFSTVFGNAIALYAARKYYDGVCSLRTSKAVINNEAVETPLSELNAMIKGEGRYRFSVYLLAIFGAICWLANVRIHLYGDPIATWGHVFDTTEHRWSFLASRFHNLYTWLIIMPWVVHVMIFSSIQLRRAMTTASRASMLRYDLLNPDQRGGFGFIDKSAIAFNVIAGLVYVQVTLHFETFSKLNLQHIVDYVVVTVLLVGVNRMFFADMYGTIKSLRVESLNKVKENVFKNDKLSFEVLKYCYERRIHTSSIIIFVTKAVAIAVPGVVKFWPVIVKTLTRA
jgi:hypothetical protein